MHHLVCILFNFINTTRQPTAEPTMRHHDTVVKTTDSIVQKVPTATPTPQTSSTTCFGRKKWERKNENLFSLLCKLLAKPSCKHPSTLASADYHSCTPSLTTSQDAKVDLKPLIISVIPIYGLSDTINLFCVLVFILINKLIAFSAS
jgi:hypothetical protein